MSSKSSLSCWWECQECGSASHMDRGRKAFRTMEQHKQRSKDLRECVESRNDKELGKAAAKNGTGPRNEAVLDPARNWGFYLEDQCLKLSLEDPWEFTDLHLGIYACSSRTFKILVCSPNTSRFWSPWQPAWNVSEQVMFLSMITLRSSYNVLIVPGLKAKNINRPDTEMMCNR